MKQKSLLLLSFMLFSVYGNSFAQDYKTEIKKVLDTWNEIGMKRDVNAFMNAFDNSDDIILVGSDSAEISSGRTEIKQFIGSLFAQFSFQWDYQSLTITGNENTAWAFTDGHMSVTDNNGKVLVTPYRFTAIFVKRGKEWKWKLYNGSIPKGEE